MDPHEAADITVAREHQRVAVREDRREAIGQALTEGVEPLEGGRTAPRHEHRDGGAGLGEIEALEQRLDLSRYRRGGDVIAIEHGGRRDHWHVTQRERFERHDVWWAAAR